MNYEQKYNKLVEAIKVLQEANPSDEGIQNWVHDNVPELKESEDERIRKELIEQVAYIIPKNDEVDDEGEELSTYQKRIDKYRAWLEKQKEPEDKGEISDGYHTFNELYRYRMLYNAAFFNLLPKHMVHKSKRHHDGEECFGGGWFIVMANLPTGQISNHYELKDWDLFQIPEKDVADEWDGHTPQEAADRLHKYLLEKQGEQKPVDRTEPKFKVGDWITNGVYTWKIVEVKPLNYILQSQGGNIVDDTISYVDEHFHYWTIKDAIDGDVLYYEWHGTKHLFIIKSVDETKDHIEVRFWYDITHNVCEAWNGSLPYSNITSMYKAIPATKEQCDLLFRKMEEDCYKFDKIKDNGKK